LLALKVIGLGEAVNIPSYNQFINEEGDFVPNELLINASNLMLTQLTRWTKGLKAIKEDK